MACLFAEVGAHRGADRAQVLAQLQRADPPVLDRDTPVTVVENGTLPQQKLAATTIGCLAEGLIDASIKGPAMIFVGAHPQAMRLEGTMATLQMHAIEPGATRCAPERWELAA